MNIVSPLEKNQLGKFLCQVSTAVLQTHTKEVSYSSIYNYNLAFTISNLAVYAKCSRR